MNPTTGVLIIHGFGGSREEVLPLAQHLEAQGIVTSVPLLPGHGKGRRFMGEATGKQWILAIREAYSLLEPRCQRIYVVGFSMGGLLAIRLLTDGFPAQNKQNDRLGGLVTVNTPVYYWNPRQILANMLQGNDRSILQKHRRTAGAYPVRAMAEFQLLLSRTKRRFCRVYCPALIVQTADDDTVWPCSGDYILRRMKGQRRLVKLPEGGHQVFQSSSSSEACRVVAEFIRITDCDFEGQ